MVTLINRGLSLLVFLAYAIGAYNSDGVGITLKVAAALLLPMACIWFPDTLGEYTGMVRGQAITTSTPAFLVCAGGWLILVGIPVIGYFVSRGM